MSSSLVKERAALASRSQLLVGLLSLLECQVHESLLNLAFSHESPFWLVCPYDTTALDGAILEEARCSHSFVAESDQPPTASDRHVPEDAAQRVAR